MIGSHSWLAPVCFTQHVPSVSVSRVLACIVCAIVSLASTWMRVRAVTCFAMLMLASTALVASIVVFFEFSRNFAKLCASRTCQV
jgi:hypothetical protein